MRESGEPMAILDTILRDAIQRAVTDIHLEEGQRPFFRKGSALYSYGSESLSKEMMEDVFGIQQYKDFSISFDTVRFRVHRYLSKGKQCAALRLIKNDTPSLDCDEDGVLLKKLCAREAGLILITGPTGSGKSFTLGACLNYINDTMNRHIVTLEDPIELIIENNRSLIHQRELYSDVSTMEQGLKEALREDPDVLMIGEMRDSETIEAALHAAETGHLVFATMHTGKAWQAVGRILSVFEGSKQEEMRSLLSQIIGAILCQRILYVDGQYHYMRDILVNTPAIANLIRQNKEHQIESVQETTRPMRTMAMAYDVYLKKWGPREELLLLKESI